MAADRNPAAAPGLRVLIAEDDEDMRSLLAMVLAGDGFAVDEVADGTALLERFNAWRDGAANEAPDIVVTDIQMPGLNGLGAVAQLRAWNPDVAVIIITAFGDARTHRRARDLNVFAVLDKPFDLADFRATVSDALDHAK
ncbi:MAG TPA: response regulator [Kofleriaceae bacterium]|nr:response regulator [Kofleriaceae bacterium]